MLFKSIHRFCSLNLFSHKLNNHLFSTNIGNDLSRNPKIQRVVSMLSQYDFSQNQINYVFESIGKYIIKEKELTEESMRETIECWQSLVRPPRLEANQLDRLNAEDIDYDMSVDFNHVVSRIEPNLLLMNANAITFRVNCLKQLGILSGSRDLWRVFVFAPNGYYLQSWTDFLKKYHYLNFQVLEWLLDKKDKNNLHPHPLVRNAKVMELSFDTIRCRYLFAQRTGLKTVSIVNKLAQIEDINQIDLKALLLTQIDKYLSLVSPNSSPEEYFALEALLNDSPTEEDEQIIEDVIELTTSQLKNFKPISNKDKQKEIENSYQTISRID